MKQKGFSLIELLIVFAIISIFATFAYSNYRNSIIRARRIDGQTALLKLALRMESYYEEHQTYQKANVDTLGCAFSSEKWYRLQITSQTDTEFQLEAIAIGVQAREDTACKTLTLHSIDSEIESPCW